MVDGIGDVDYVGIIAGVISGDPNARCGLLDEQRTILAATYTTVNKQTKIKMRHPRPLFTKPTDLLPKDLMEFRNREIRISTFPIALKVDMQLGSSGKTSIRLVIRGSKYGVILLM